MPNALSCKYFLVANGFVITLVRLVKTQPTAMILMELILFFILSLLVTLSALKWWSRDHTSMVLQLTLTWLTVTAWDLWPYPMLGLYIGDQERSLGGALSLLCFLALYVLDWVKVPWDESSWLALREPFALAKIFKELIKVRHSLQKEHLVVLAMLIGAKASAKPSRQRNDTPWLIFGGFSVLFVVLALFLTSDVGLLSNQLALAFVLSLLVISFSIDIQTVRRAAPDYLRVGRLSAMLTVFGLVHDHDFLILTLRITLVLVLCSSVVFIDMMTTERASNDSLLLGGFSLLATLLLLSSGDLITLALSLRLLGLSSYCLVCTPKVAPWPAVYGLATFIIFYEHALPIALLGYHTIYFL